MQGQVPEWLGLLEKELEVVMKAGERHPRNYYGWEYARAVVRIVGERVSDEGNGMEDLIGESVEKVKGWCFMHPRDVSGWCLLVWLVERMGEGLDDGIVGKDQIAGKVMWEAQEFVRKYEWRGESMEWLLKNIERLTTDTPSRRFNSTKAL